MEEKQTDFDLDKYILTANLTFIAGFLLIFQIIPKSAYVRGALIFAFSSLVISFVLFIWSSYRMPIRKKYFAELQKDLSEKYSEKIANFVENVAKPLTRMETGLEALKKILKSSSKKDAKYALEEMKNDETYQSKDKERYYDVIESFISLMSIESKKNYENAFRRPLKERNSSVKSICDRVAFKYKYHFFIGGLGSTLVAVVLHLLS